MLPIAAKRRSPRAGQAIIMITVSLFFLFSVMALAVDLGLAYVKRQQLQTAADAASQGGAMFAAGHTGTCNTANPCTTSYTCDGTTPATNSLQSACLYAAANGFTQGGNGGRQTVTASAGTGAPGGTSGLTSSSYWVKVAVSETMPGLFMFNNGYRVSAVAADATAAVTPSINANCIYALNRTGLAKALYVDGSQVINTNCVIYVNSTSSQAMYVTGSNNLTANAIKVVGNYYNDGSNNFSPAPTTGAAPVADPLANVPQPTVGTTCDYNNYAGPSGGTVNLSPGVYCGGINFSGSATINLASGVYIMKGGGMRFSGSNHINGSGVMFYNTTNSSGVAGNMTVDGSDVLNLSAPSTGTYRGIMFFQNRAVTNTVTWTGSSSNGFTGTVYVPAAQLMYDGSQTAVFQALIADNITFTGSSYFKNDTTGQYTGLSRTAIGLVK